MEEERLVMVRAEARSADVARLLALEQEVFGPQSYSAWGVASLCHHGASYLFTLEDAVVGHAMLMTRWRSPDEAYLGSFAIVEHLRGRGLGRRALALLLDQLRAEGIRRLELTVEPANEAAQKLYRGAGFVAVGFIRECYGPGEDRDVLALGLADPRAAS